MENFVNIDELLNLPDSKQEAVYGEVQSEKLEVRSSRQIVNSLIVNTNQECSINLIFEKK